MIRILGICVLILAVSVGCSRKSSAVTTLPEGFSCEWNSTKTYALCLSTTENNKSKLPVTEYQIISKDSNEVTSGTIGLGEVKWLNNDVIEVYETPGNVQVDFTPDSVARVYIISEGVYTSKTSYLKR